MDSMIKDALNFLRFQSREIEHYNQYSIALILFILALMAVPFSWISESYEIVRIPDIVIDEIYMIGASLLGALFFVYWFGRKDKKYSFATLFKFFGVMGIGSYIPSIAGALIAFILDYSLVSVIIQLLLFVYVLVIIIITTSKATGVTQSYVLGGSLIVLAIIFLSMMIFFLLVIRLIN
jgi:hypothetical protein